MALLIDLGFDVNATNRLDRYRDPRRSTKPQREGNLEVIKVLLAHGADPNLKDTSYNSTPAGWAENFGRTDAQRYLEALET